MVCTGALPPFPPRPPPSDGFLLFWAPVFLFLRNTRVMRLKDQGQACSKCLRAASDCGLCPRPLPQVPPGVSRAFSEPLLCGRQSNGEATMSSGPPGLTSPKGLCLSSGTRAKREGFWVVIKADVISEGLRENGESRTPRAVIQY